MKVPFLDLKTQYEAIRNNVNSRIQAVLEHGAFVNGPEVFELEKKLQEFTGVPYCLSCSNGTDALILPLMALGIEAGDEIITTSFSFIATAEVIALMGAKPIYVDTEPDSYNIDPKKIRGKITKKTKAIIPVSLYGQPSDMDEINALASEFGLHVIEDAAQSFGATYKNRRSCNLSLAAGTSFFPAKPLGCYGDGGAVFTQSKELYTAMREIREHGSESRYYHTRLGINGRLDTLQCAILLAKLDRYEWEMKQRQTIANKYTEAFQSLNVDGLRLPLVRKDRTSVWAQYTVEVSNRSQVQKKLGDLGVPTAIHYPRVMPDQPWYQEHTPCSDPLPVSRRSAEMVLSLPLHSELTLEAQDHVIQSFISVMKG